MLDLWTRYEIVFPMRITTSIRSNLDIDRFEEISFELPDISVQRKYVDIYKAIRRVQKLNVKIKDLCPILVRSAVREGRDI